MRSIRCDVGRGRCLHRESASVIPLQRGVLGVELVHLGV